LDRLDLVQTLKSSIENTHGCSTKSTPKKGAGFVLYNRHGIKWGQIDVADSRIHIVLDLYPKRYVISKLSISLGIPLKVKNERKTGMFMKLTDGSPPNYDALEISLYNDYFLTISSLLLDQLIQFIVLISEESQFKTRPSY
jgi:hypothetical protein